MLRVYTETPVYHHYYYTNSIITKTDGKYDLEFNNTYTNVIIVTTPTSDLLLSWGTDLLVP